MNNTESTAKAEAIANADAHLSNVDLPTYSSLVQHLSYLVSQAELSDLASSNNAALAKARIELAKAGIQRSQATLDAEEQAVSNAKFQASVEAAMLSQECDVFLKTQGLTYDPGINAGTVDICYEEDGNRLLIIKSSISLFELKQILEFGTQEFEKGCALGLKPSTFTEKQDAFDAISLSKECEDFLASRDLTSQESSGSTCIGIFNEDGAKLLTVTKAISYIDLHNLLQFSTREFEKGRVLGKTEMQHQIRSVLGITS